jgi:acyl dehydratase
MTEQRIQRMEIGDKFATPPKMVTKTDVETFCSLSGMSFPLFLSDEYVKADKERQELVKLEGALVPGQLSFAIFMGNMVNSHLLDDVVVQLGTTNLRWPAPAYHYDMLRTEIEIVGKRTTKAGTIIMDFDWWLKNQNDVVVCEGHNT